MNAIKERLSRTQVVPFNRILYTEAKVDVTQEIEQRAQQAAQAGADHCALCSISCVTSTLASVYVQSSVKERALGCVIPRLSCLWPRGRVYAT